MWQKQFKRRVAAVFLGVLALGALTGCVRTEADLAAARVPVDPAECKAPASSACYFRNSPVKLLPERVRIPGRPLDFFPIAAELEFIDGRNKTWVAPVRTLTDGASIPQIFVPIVGQPQDPTFVNAAAVHDAYCGIGNEAGPVYQSATWQEVHQMFYDTLVVGGTPEPKAQLMFAAVWLGGPRWYPRQDRAGVSMSRPDVSMDLLPAALRRAAMVETRNFINASKPTLPQLIRYMNWQEWEMKRIISGKAGSGSGGPGNGFDLEGSEFDPTTPITGGGGSAGAVQGP